MSDTHQKVTASHLQREAYLYMRQSLRQVFENTESMKRQYGLRQRAVALGWPQDHIVVMAVLLIWTLAFNLLQLFVYRRLGRCRRPKDPTDTIRHIIEVMLRDVATLPEPIPWTTLLLNTS